MKYIMIRNIMCDLLGFIMFCKSTIMYFIMFLDADYLPPSLHTLTCLESAIRSLVVYILVEFFPKE